MLQGLVKMPEYNRRVVKLIGFHHGLGRWACQCRTGYVYNIRAENLRPLPLSVPRVGAKRAAYDVSSDEDGSARHVQGADAQSADINRCKPTMALGADTTHTGLLAEVAPRGPPLGSRVKGLGPHDCVCLDDSEPGPPAAKVKGPPCPANGKASTQRVSGSDVEKPRETRKRSLSRAPSGGVEKKVGGQAPAQSVVHPVEKDVVPSRSRGSEKKTVRLGSTQSVADLAVHRADTIELDSVTECVQDAQEPRTTVRCLVESTRTHPATDTPVTDVPKRPRSRARPEKVAKSTACVETSQEAALCAVRSALSMDDWAGTPAVVPSDCRRMLVDIAPAAFRGKWRHKLQSRFVSLIGDALSRQLAALSDSKDSACYQQADQAMRSFEALHKGI